MTSRMDIVCKIVNTPPDFTERDFRLLFMLCEGVLGMCYDRASCTGVVSFDNLRHAYAVKQMFCGVLKEKYLNDAVFEIAESVDDSFIFFDSPEKHAEVHANRLSEQDFPSFTEANSQNLAVNQSLSADAPAFVPQPTAPRTAAFGRNRYFSFSMPSSATSPVVRGASAPFEPMCEYSPSTDDIFDLLARPMQARGKTLSPLDENRQNNAALLSASLWKDGSGDGSMPCDRRFDEGTAFSADPKSPLSPHSTSPVPAYHVTAGAINSQRSLSIGAFPSDYLSCTGAGSRFTAAPSANSYCTARSVSYSSGQASSFLGENAPCNTLYVGNLPINASEEELRALFSTCIGYKRLSFRMKPNGPMCFVEFEDIHCATLAMNDLYGVMLSTSSRTGIRLSYSKNPLGVKPAGSGTNSSSQFGGGFFGAACMQVSGIKGPTMTLDPIDLIPAPLIENSFSI